MKKKPIAIAGALLALAGAGLGLAWFFRAQRIAQFARTPFGSEETKTLEIQQGTGPRALANLLAQKAVVSDPDDFYAYIRREQAGPKLKHGEYEFKGALTPAQVLEKVVNGQVKVYRFTVPEGLRAEEILDIASNSELKLDRAKLAALVKDPAFLKKAGVPANRIEGFLFPDTYTFSRGATEDAVLNRMISRTLDEYRRADAHRKAGVQLNELQTIALASIIEKETAAKDERPRISCVFHNRLRLHMKLGTDPTVLYAMMLIRGHYVNNITRQDLVTPHPYNTYTTVGLPPGPIASPGAAAIEAALNPIDCNDLYFVSRNNGTHIFCPDLKCHNAAVKKWQVDYFRQQRQNKARTQR